MILVTGGAGFIGSNLVAALSDRGKEVVVCDRFGSDDKWRNLAHSEITELVTPEQLPQLLERRGKEIRHVFHLGAVTSTLETNVDLILDVNVGLSRQIWEWCRQHKVPLIYASSAATYGDGSQGFEDDGSPKALASLRPLNAYGWSKHLFDRWVAREVTAGRHPPQWVGLKLFNVYGPNEYHKGDMRSVLAKSYAVAARGEAVKLFRSHNPAYPDGGQKRDFIYVQDCVDVMLWLMENQGVSGLFNLGTGRARTWLDLMRALYDAVDWELNVAWMDVPKEMRPRYQYFTEARMDRLRAAGYQPPFVPIEEGVRDYVWRFLATDDPYR